MKHFLTFILKILLVTFAVFVVLDFLYANIYMQSYNRGKIDNVYYSAARNYDVVILGSSRASNHFVAPMFEEKGLRTYNYGMCGSHLFEASLMLKLMLERNYKIKNIILEADLNLSNEQQADAISAHFLPYLHYSEIIKKHFSRERNFAFVYYLPFYRFAAFESRIGFREMIFSLIHKKSKALENSGYEPLPNDSKGNMKNSIVGLRPLQNKYYEEIKQICKANNIRLISVMTPMCSNVKGMEYFHKVKALYPEIHNYEKVVQEDDCFSSCGHMNDKGARIFTAKVIKDFFN